MDNNLYTILKELKSIQPDDNYTKQSKMLILSSEKILHPKPYTLNLILNWFNFKHSAMLAGAVAIFIFIIYGPCLTSRVIKTALSQKRMK